MYLLILSLPLIGCLFSGLLGRYLGYRGAGLFASTCVSLSAIVSWCCFYEIGLGGSPCYVRLAPWFFSEMFDASWSFIFDSLSIVMLITVTTASSCIHFYSLSYMEMDPHLPRFMAYLSIFTFFMLILVTADNFILMFFGWEGIGLASYLLINFWVTRQQANKSGLKAMLVNKIGDFGLAVGIFFIYMLFQTVDYASVFSCSPYFLSTSIYFLDIEFDALTLTSCFIFLGVVGKSAQIGLHTWLPDAMEGPTPVSALIHAATLVTAGVFLLARISPMLEYAPSALNLIGFTGAMTCFVAASTGIVQNDLKRVIAYSTCSQLGYMVFACGLSNYSVSIFHLMNHAFFKALLFLSAGSIIHALADEQDLRKMGSLARILPYTYIMILIGSLSLVGFPFLTGFYSKDVILELAYSEYNLLGNFAYWLGSFSVIMTAFYSFKLIFLTFWSPKSIAPTWLKLKSNNLVKPAIGKLRHDAAFILALALWPLAFGSLFLGYFAKDLMIGLGTPFWGNAIFSLPSNSLFVESEWIPTDIKLIPFMYTLLGIVLAFATNLLATHQVFRFKLTSIGRNLYLFFNLRWLFDIIYNEWVAKTFLFFGYQYSFKLLDRGIIDMIGPSGITLTIKNLMKELKSMQTGLISHYALIMLVSLCTIISLIGFDFIIDSKVILVYIISFLFLNLPE